jgi:hypothetical protein
METEVELPNPYICKTRRFYGMEMYWCKAMHPDPGMCQYAELLFPDSYICHHPDRSEQQYNKL